MNNQGQQEQEQLLESQNILRDIQSQILHNVEPAGPSYGNELWDCLNVVKESTDSKQKQINAIKNFFKSYKKSLDAFKDGVKSALKIFEKEIIVPQSQKGYKLGQKAQNQNLLKKSQKSEAHSIQNCLIDTLSSCLFNCKLSLDDIIIMVENQTIQIQKDLIDSLENHEKNYIFQNKIMIKKGQDLWNKMYNDKQILLSTKEEYFDSMKEYCQLKNRLEQKDQKKRDRSNSQQLTQTGNQPVTANSEEQILENNLYTLSQQSGDTQVVPAQQSNVKMIEPIERAKQQALIAQNNYQIAVESFNESVIFFEMNYKPIMNKIQEKDQDYTDFIKLKINNFSMLNMQFGLGINKSGEKIKQSCDTIDSQTDMNIFIEVNKSNNSFIKQEIFQKFDENLFNQKHSQNSSRKNSNTSASSEQNPFISALSVEDRQPLGCISESDYKFSNQIQLDHAPGTFIYKKDSEITSQQTGAIFDLISPSENFENDFKFIQEMLRQMINESIPISAEQKAQIIHLIYSSVKIRMAITDVLQQINSPKHVLQIECLRLLSELIKFLLTLFVHEKQIDYDLLRAILESSAMIFYLKNNRKTLLTHLIMDHGIWKDVQAWKECIDANIKIKMKESQERMKKRQLPKAGANQQEQSMFLQGKGLLGMGLGKIKNFMQSKESKFNQDLEKHSNLIFNELSRYMMLLCNFSVPFEKAYNLLLYLCQFYQMDKNKMQILLTELMSNQKNTQSMFTVKEKNLYSLMKRGERLQKFGHSDVTTIIGLTIKFIDKDIVLRRLISLNRDLNEILRTEVLKQSLLRADIQEVNLKRRDLWLQILGINIGETIQEYEILRSQVIQNLPADVAESINVDVKRSFHQMKYLTHESLSNILKTYALQNPKLNYCQGMNFSAGFLFLSMMPNQITEKNFNDLFSFDVKQQLYVQAESLSFGVLKNTIERYQLASLFNKDLPMLKLMFYQLDRLISIYLPDLHDHFKDEQINSSFFSSSFFITIFTSHIQNQTDDCNIWKVQRVWDHFILKGWKVVFKVCLLVLKNYEEQLLGMGFEEMLGILVNLPNMFLIGECENLRKKYQGQTQFAEGEQFVIENNLDFEKAKQQEIIDLDRNLKKIKIPIVLLERIKREFDESHALSNIIGKPNEKESSLSQR